MSPVRVRAEVEGFVFNRLQGAVLREAYCLVRDGVASVDDLDRVVRDGLGRRWALIGPFETSDLNTRGGIGVHAARLGPAYARMGAERGQHDPWTAELVELVVAARRAELPLEYWDERVAWRDRALMGLERARRGLERFAGESASDDGPERPRDADVTSSPGASLPPALAAIAAELGLVPGLEHRIDLIVSPELQTDVDGTLPHPVLASPQMIRLMERAAVKSVADRLPPGHTTVGFEVSVRHVAAAPAGAACTARARLREIVDGRKLRFDVEVVSGDQTIGTGTHERRLVNVCGVSGSADTVA
jgi:predicted thioesterase